MCVWIQKKYKRFVETVLLSTHETLHIKNYTLYSQYNVSNILFAICGCIDVPGFELSMFYSIAATSKKNSVFASSANMSKLLLLLRWFLAKMRHLWNRQAVPYYFRFWWRSWRDVFPRGSTLTIHSPFGKVRIYGDIKTSFLRKVRVKTHRFLWCFDILWKVNKKCRPAGKHIISSGPSSAAAEMIVEIIYAGTHATWIKICKALFSVN